MANRQTTQALRCSNSSSRMTPAIGNNALSETGDGDVLEFRGLAARHLAGRPKEGGGLRSLFLREVGNHTAHDFYLHFVHGHIFQPRKDRWHHRGLDECRRVAPELRAVEQM